MSRMRKEVTRLASGSVAQSAANAGVAVLSTRWLSPEERGVMVVAATIPALVSVLATLGVGNALRARRPSADTATQKQLGRAFTSLVMLTALLAAVTSAALGGLAAFLTFPQLSSATVLMSLALGGATLCCLSTLTDAWFAGGDFGGGARWAAMSAVAGLAATAVLRPSTAGTFLVTQFLAMGTVMVASLVLLHRRGLLGRPSADRATMSMLVRKGAPSLGFVAGTTLTLRSDRLILAGFVSPAAVAVYALASTVSEVVRIVPTALGQLALQRGAHDPSAPVRDLRRKGALVVAAAGMLGLPVAALTISPVFGPAYDTTWKLLAVMLLGEIFFCGYLVTGMNLVGRGTPHRVAVIALWGALLCVAFYATGSYLAGGVGCAIAGVGLYAILDWMSRRTRDHAPHTTHPVQT